MPGLALCRIRVHSILCLLHLCQSQVRLLWLVYMHIEHGLLLHMHGVRQHQHLQEAPDSCVEDAQRTLTSMAHRVTTMKLILNAIAPELVNHLS